MPDASDLDYLSAAFDPVTPPSEDRSIGALDVYRPERAEPNTTSEEDSVQTVVFTAHNPEWTVTATALMNGQILRIELASDVIHLTEQELGEEIGLVCEVARMQARAAQHAILASLLRKLGRDPAETESFLWRQLGLPTPQMLSTRRTEVFAGRHPADAV